MSTHQPPYRGWHSAQPSTDSPSAVFCLSQVLDKGTLQDIFFPTYPRGSRELGFGPAKRRDFGGGAEIGIDGVKLKTTEHGYPWKMFIPRDLEEAHQKLGVRPLWLEPTGSNKDESSSSPQSYDMVSLSASHPFEVNVEQVKMRIKEVSQYNYSDSSRVGDSEAGVLECFVPNNANMAARHLSSQLEGSFPVLIGEEQCWHQHLPGYKPDKYSGTSGKTSCGLPSCSQPTVKYLVRVPGDQVSRVRERAKDFKSRQTQQRSDPWTKTFRGTGRWQEEKVRINSSVATMSIDGVDKYTQWFERTDTEQEQDPAHCDWTGRKLYRSPEPFRFALQQGGSASAAGETTVAKLAKSPNQARVEPGQTAPLLGRIVAPTDTSGIWKDLEVVSSVKILGNQRGSYCEGIRPPAYKDEKGLSTADTKTDCSVQEPEDLSCESMSGKLKGIALTDIKDSRSSSNLFDTRAAEAEIVADQASSSIPVDYFLHEDPSVTFLELVPLASESDADRDNAPRFIHSFKDPGDEEGISTIRYFMPETEEERYRRMEEELIPSGQEVQTDHETLPSYQQGSRVQQGPSGLAVPAAELPRQGRGRLRSFLDTITCCK